jgi:hypothetical protein
MTKVFAVLRGQAIAITALCVALGGTSYAAIKLPKKSVGSAQLKNNSVTSSKVKNRSLARDDFKAGQLPAGTQGPPGRTGSQGPAGAQGPRGEAPGASFSAANTTTTINSPLDTTAPFTVLTLSGVPAGRYVITAKASVDNDDAGTVVVTCRLKAGGVVIDESREGLGTEAANDDYGTPSLQATRTLAATTDLTLDCDNPGGTASDTDVTFPSIVATQVGSINGG